MQLFYAIPLLVAFTSGVVKTDEKATTKVEDSNTTTGSSSTADGNDDDTSSSRNNKDYVNNPPAVSFHPRRASKVKLKPIDRSLGPSSCK